MFLTGIHSQEKHFKPLLRQKMTARRNGEGPVKTVLGLINRKALRKLVQSSSNKKLTTDGNAADIMNAILRHVRLFSTLIGARLKSENMSIEPKLEIFLD